MDFTPGNSSLCLVLSEAAVNTTLSEVSECWQCEELPGFSNQLSNNLSYSTNCTECLEDVCADFLDNQNQSWSQSMLPVAAFIGILMLLGIPGNTIVLVVYYFKQQKTTANKFMMALASIDLHACLVIHPYIISKMFHFYSPTAWVCKMFEYLLHVTQSIQGTTLLAVAVDRYYAVYKPMAFGYAENAAYAIPLCFVVGIAGSIPMIIFYGEKTIWLYDEHREIHIRTHVCHYSDKYDGSRDYIIFTFTALFLLLVIVTIISILYILIAIKIRKRNAQIGALVIPVAPVQADSKNSVNKETKVLVHSPIHSTDPSQRPKTQENCEGEDKEPDGTVQNSTTTSDTSGQSKSFEEATAKKGKRKSTPFSLEISSLVHQNDHRNDKDSEGGIRKITTTSLGSTRQHSPMTRPNEINPTTDLDIQPIAHCSSTTPAIYNTPSTSAVLPQSTTVKVPHSVPDEPLRIHVAPAAHTGSKLTAGFKGCKLLFIVTVVFFLSWLPFWVIGFMYGSAGWWSKTHVIYKLLTHLFFLNNAANPILYAFMNSKFREECKLTKKKISTRLRYIFC